MHLDWIQQVPTAFGTKSHFTPLTPGLVLVYRWSGGAVLDTQFGGYTEFFSSTVYTMFYPTVDDRIRCGVNTTQKWHDHLSSSLQTFLPRKSAANPSPPGWGDRCPSEARDVWGLLWGCLYDPSRHRHGIRSKSTDGWTCVIQLSNQGSPPAWHTHKIVGIRMHQPSFHQLQGLSNCKTTKKNSTICLQRTPATPRCSLTARSFDRSSTSFPSPLLRTGHQNAPPQQQHDADADPSDRQIRSSVTQASPRRRSPFSFGEDFRYRLLNLFILQKSR